MSGCVTSSCLNYTTGAAGQSFQAAIEFFAAAQCLLTENWPQQAQVQDGDRFDMIIVGGGTTGSVLAARLSEVSDWNVLLIEAGPDPTLESIIPSMWKAAASKDDWNYLTTSDSHKCKGFNNGSYFVLRGKVLGGCSTTNELLYARGAESEYNAWYEAGNEGWNWDTVLRYMKKAETLKTDTVDNITRSFHGDSGPISISRYNYIHEDINDNLIKSFGELGVEVLSDINGKNRLGVSRFLSYFFEGRRVSSATAYLNPARNRSNLFVLKNTHVTKVLIDECCNRTTGVQVILEDGSEATFYADLEVIVSAGTINSPQLLMLSGIGPKHHLESVGVKVKKNLPVGENYRDHVILHIPIITNREFLLNEDDNYFEYIKYLYNRTGVLSSLGVTVPDVITNVNTNSSLSYPEFEIISNLFTDQSTANAVYKGLNYVDSVVESLTNMNSDGKQVFFFYCIMLHEESTGYVRLSDADPTSKPIIYPNFYGDPSDVDKMLKCVRFLTNILDTEYFKALDSRIGRVNLTECNDYEFKSDEYWGCMAVHTSTTSYHPVGTCKMGPRWDPTTVVDSALLVHGMENLRVADASIFPTTVSGHPASTCTMVGENVADTIKKTYCKI